MAELHPRWQRTRRAWRWCVESFWYFTGTLICIVIVLLDLLRGNYREASNMMLGLGVGSALGYTIGRFVKRRCF